jgi:hypothetical protein
MYVRYPEVFGSAVVVGDFNPSDEISVSGKAAKILDA